MGFKISPQGLPAGYVYYTNVLIYYIVVKYKYSNFLLRSACMGIFALSDYFRNLHAFSSAIYN